MKRIGFSCLRPIFEVLVVFFYSISFAGGTTEESEYKITFVDPSDPQRTVQVDITLPVLGKVRLVSEPGTDGVPRHVYGELPSKDGGGLDLLFLHWDEGKFDLLPDGALSYVGSGKIFNTPVQIGLKRLRFLTETEKKRMDGAYTQQVEDREQQQRFIAYLEQAGKKVLAEKQQLALDNRESELEDTYGSVQYREKWLKLQERSLERLWKDFLEVDDEFLIQKKGQHGIAKQSSQGQAFGSLVVDNFTVGEAVFSLTSAEGFFPITLADARVFNVQEAELVFAYKQAPFVRGKVKILDQLMEIRIGFDFVKKTFFIALGAHDFKIASFIPALQGIFEDQAVDFLRFSGTIEISSTGELTSEGKLFDSRTGKPWDASVVQHFPLSIQSFRLHTAPSAITTFQALGRVFASDVEIFASIGSVHGHVFRATLQPAQIRSYVPSLPEGDFSDLLLAGRVELSKKEGLLLRGKLKSKESGTISLWGIDLQEALLDLNLLKLTGKISGKFKIVDLEAKALFSLSLGEKKELSFSAEVLNPALTTWQPPSLEQYAKGSVEGFALKNIRLVCGVEQGRSPVKNLKESFKSSSLLHKTDEKKQDAVKIPLEGKKKISFFCAVSGEAVLVGQLCRAMLKVEKGKRFGFIVLAEPVHDFSLSGAFPEYFEHKSDDNFFFQYIKNVFGYTALSNLSLVLSTVSDLEAGIEPGLNFTGAAAYVGDPYQNPLFKNLFATAGTAQLPIYLKKDGSRGLGFDISGVIDPINFKNTRFVLKGGTGDFGIFLSGAGLEEVGAKDLAVELVFYPLQVEAAVKLSGMYLAKSSLKPMKIAVEVAADIVGIGGAVSGAGDFDFGVYAAVLAGKGVRDTLEQRIIVRDVGLEFRTTWAALLSAAGGIASAPTVIGAIAGAAGTILTGIGSLGLSGGFEIGQLNDPLIGFFACKGGLDISELVLEMHGEKTGGFTSLVLFLLDVFSYLITVGQKDKLFDMRNVQEVIKNIVPLDLEKFYLKLVPIGTRIGEVGVPFGLGGSLYVRLFGAVVGFDTLLDAKGFYGVGYVDPMDFAGIYKLRPSKTIGASAQALEASFKGWNLKKASDKNTQEQVAFEVVAHLDEGLRVKTDFDVELAQMARGSMRVNLGLSGLDLQGDLELKVPEILRSLGLEPGSLRLWVKGTQVNLDNPLLLLKQLAPENIALEVGFENTAVAALEKSITNKLKTIEDVFAGTIQAILSTFLTKPAQRELFFAEEKMKRFCANMEEYAVPCGKAKVEYEGLKARSFILDRLDGLPGVARTFLQKFQELGVGILSDGRIAFSDWTKLFRINRIFWRGSLADVMNGKIPGFSIQLTFMGNEIEWTNVAGIDFTKNPAEELNLFVQRLTKGIAIAVLKQFGSSVDSKQITALMQAIAR